MLTTKLICGEIDKKISKIGKLDIVNTLDRVEKANKDTVPSQKAERQLN